MSLLIGLRVKKFMDILIVPVPIIFFTKRIEAQLFFVDKAKKREQRTV
jgi:hypothetical protein